MWTQQQLSLLQFHCGPLWLELQPSQVNEVNNRLLHEPYDPLDSEREAYVRSHTSTCEYTGRTCLRLHSFEAPDLVDSVQEFSAAHALSKLASIASILTNGIRTTTLQRD
jgi:hypothetical protein